MSAWFRILKQDPYPLTQLNPDPKHWKQRTVNFMVLVWIVPLQPVFADLDLDSIGSLDLDPGG